MMVTLESGFGGAFFSWASSLFDDEEPTVEECEQVALDLDAMGKIALARKLRGQPHNDGAATSELFALDAETRERVNACNIAAGAAALSEADASLTPEERADLAHAGYLECVKLHGPFSGVCVGGTMGAPTETLAQAAQDEIDRRAAASTAALAAAGLFAAWLILRGR